MQSEKGWAKHTDSGKLASQLYLWRLVCSNAVALAYMTHSHCRCTVLQNSWLHLTQPLGSTQASE